MDGHPLLDREAVREALSRLARPDNWTSLWYLALEYGLLAGLIGLGIGWLKAWQMGLVWLPWFLMGAMPIAGGVAVVQHRLSALAHEASHYMLFRNRLANELVSDLFLLFPLVALTQRYRAAHWSHHMHVNDPERDADLVRLNHPEPHLFPISRWGFWRRYVLVLFYPPGVLRYLMGRARAANLGPEGEGDRVPAAIYRPRVALRMRGAYWLVLLTVVHASGCWPVFFLFWVVPLLTVYPLLMQLREIGHHSNAPDDGEFTNSRVFRVHPIVRFCILPYGQDYHLTHHVHMSVPHYRLSEAHGILMRFPPYREQVVVCDGYFWGRRGKGLSLLDLLAMPRDEVMNEARRRRVKAKDSGSGNVSPNPRAA